MGEAGVSVNELSGRGRTALMIASSNGNKEVIKALVAWHHQHDVGACCGWWCGSCAVVSGVEQLCEGVEGWSGEFMH